MLDDENRHALAAQGAQQLAERALLLAAQARRGLVEDEQHRVGGEGACDLERALGAERQAARQLVGAPGEADPGELAHRLGEALPLFAAVEPEAGRQQAGAGTAVGAEGDVVEQAHLRPELDVLEGARQAEPGEPPLREGRDVAAEKLDPARRHRQGSRQQVEQGRLARPVRADQADDLAGADLEADVVDGDQPAEALDRAAHGEDRRAGRRQRAPRQRLGASEACGIDLGRREPAPRPAPHEAHQAAACVLQEQDEEHRERDGLELAGALRQQRQRVLQHVLQQQHHGGAGERAAQLAEAAAHRHQQVLDARPHVEGRGADEAVHVRVEPAGEAGEQCGEDEQREANPERIGADARQQHRATAQAADRATGPRLQQIAVEDEGEPDQRPDQVVDRLRLDQRPTADTQRRDIGKPGVPAEGVDVAEQQRDREPPGDRAERQEVAAEAQRQEADRQRGEAGQREGEDEAEPGRRAMRGGEPRAGVGGDADEGGLAERGRAADAGEQHQAERDQRADADVVEQRDAELAEPERRQRDHRDGDRDDRAMAARRRHSSISSSSSSAWAEKNERSRSAGMSRLKTITSFSAPL